MSTQVIINGKEITNPAAKASLVLGAILIAALITALIVFVLLPLVGVAVTLSVGLVAILFIASLIGIVSLLFGATLFGWLFGPMQFRFKKQRK